MDTPISQVESAALPHIEPQIGTIGQVEEKFETTKAINYSVANLGASVFYGLFNFAMPLYLNSYGLPAWLVGLLANERSFVGAFVQPAVGRLSDRTRTPVGRRKPFFLVGIPLVCLGLFGLALHPPFWEMLTVTAVLGFFLAVAWDPYMAMMADLFPPLQRGRVGGLVGLGTALGNIIFAVMALVLWAKQEFLAFGIVIVMLIITWTYTFITVKEPAVPAEQEERVKFNFRAYIRNLAQYPEVAKYVLAVNFFWLGTGGVIPFITLFGVKALHATESQAFILPIAATVANAIASVPLGFLADKIGKKTVMIGGMTTFGIIALIGAQSTNLLQGTIALALAGAANAAMAQINPMLTDLAPKKRMAEFVGLGSAVFSFAQPLGSVVAGLTVGVAAMFVSDNDAYRWAFMMAGVMLLLAAFLLRTVHPERANKD